MSLPIFDSVYSRMCSIISFWYVILHTNIAEAGNCFIWIKKFKNEEVYFINVPYLMFISQALSFYFQKGVNREWSDPSRASVWTGVMRGLGCLLQLRAALVVCTWRWGGTEPRHKSTNRLCVRSRLTSSGSRLIPPAARSRCVSPVPLEERKQQISIHLHEASQDIFITSIYFTVHIICFFIYLLNKTSFSFCLQSATTEAVWTAVMIWWNSVRKITRW